MTAATPRSAKPPYSVLVIPPGDVHAAGLRSMLEREQMIAPVLEAAVPELAWSISRLRPDLVVVVGDHREDVILRVAQELRRLATETKLLVFADAPEYPLEMALLRLKIAGFAVWDDVTRITLPGLLQSVLEGGWFVASPGAVQELVLPPGRRRGGTEPPSVTGNERMLLEGLVRGASDEELARQIGRTARTVRRMFTELEVRFDARNRAHLAVLASGLGFGEEQPGSPL